MKKKDIKSGMVVKLRMGIWCLVINHEDKVIFVSKHGSQLFLERYNFNLIHFTNEMWDIVSVAKTEPHNLIALNESEFNIIWEREERIEMTIEEIEKELGFNIKIVK